MYYCHVAKVNFANLVLDVCGPQCKMWTQRLSYLSLIICVYYERNLYYDETDL